LTPLVTGGLKIKNKHTHTRLPKRSIPERYYRWWVGGGRERVRKRVMERGRKRERVRKGERDREKEMDERRESER